MAEQLTARKGHGRVGRRGRPRDQVHDLAHRRALGHDAGPSAQGGAQAGDLLPEPPLAQGVLEGGEKLLDAERLGDVMVGAGLHRLDGRVDAAEGGDDDHRRPGLARAHLPQELVAAHARHHQVRDHDVDGPVSQLVEGLGAARGAQHVVARLAQLVVQELPHRVVVLDDEQRGTPRHDARASRPAAAGVSSGRKTLSRAPRPASLSTSIQPPCSFTIP